MYIIWLVVSIDACFHISLFKTIGILNPNWRAKRNHQRVNFAFFFIFKTLSETLLEVLHKHSEIIRSCFRKVTIKKHHRLRIIYSTTWFHVFTVAGKFLVSCIYNYMHIAAAYIHIDIVRWNQQIKLKWLNHASSPINTNNMFNQVFNQCLQKAPRSFACRLLGPSNYFDITTIIPRSMYCSCEPTCF